MSSNRHRLLGVALTATLMMSVVTAMAAPKRVVSMNLCTDQLAMMIAAPGQLYSVSYLAAQLDAPEMAKAAAGYEVNHGLAEEIFLMQPDLVIAGTYTTRTTVSMLRRLGFPVEEFAPEATFDDVRTNIRRMGEILGRGERATAMISALDAGLRDLANERSERKIAATYSSNSYTAGKGSLTEAVIAAAGLRNLGSELGIQGSGRLSLETLVLSRADLLTSGDRSDDRPALAQQNFVHPAYRAVRAATPAAVVPESYWICGSPFTVEAARMLRDAAYGEPSGSTVAE